MRVFRIWLALAMAWIGEVAWAQSTTVQLPTYQSFAAGTTVSVPDRGSVYLGGVKRAQSGMNEFGSPLSPFRNRAIGSQRSASGMSVSVYIHDFEALEEELLSRSGASDQKLTTVRSPDGTTRAVVRSPDRATAATAGLKQRRGDPRAAPLPSVEEIRRQRLADQEARQAEAEDFFERGQAAEESGKRNVARMYYQMAAKRAAGTLKDQVVAKLDSLRREPTPKLARTEP